MAIDFSLEELQSQRAAFREAMESKFPYPLKEGMETPRYHAQSEWSEGNLNRRVAERTALRLQPALPGDAFDEVFSGGTRPDHTISMIGDCYGRLHIRGTDAKTRRSLEGSQLVASMYDQYLEEAKKLKERLEGGAGGPNKSKVWFSEE